MFRKKDEASVEERNLEEQYEKLFPKVARDFVYREDMEAFIENLTLLLRAVLPGFAISITQDRAKDRALKYREVLESGEDGSKKFEDVIKPAEEEME